MTNPPRHKPAHYRAQSFGNQRRKLLTRAVYACDDPPTPNAEAAMTNPAPRYTQDGANILRDGAPITIAQALADLNAVYVEEDARVDLYRHRSGTALERAAEFLPEGFELVVRAERNAGHVELNNYDEEQVMEFHYEDDDECFADVINRAIDAATGKAGDE